MIKSMTGYGRARQMRNKRDITVEVRSVNNRYLDCTVKMPRMYTFAEDAVKACVQKAVSRGKVDVYITVDASAADVAKVTVNRELAAQYAAALGELAEVCGTEAHVTPETLSRFPDVLTVTKEDEDLETVSADLCAVLEEALAAYNQMRAVEGQKLAEDIGGSPPSSTTPPRWRSAPRRRWRSTGQSSPPGWRRCSKAPPSIPSGF